MSGEQLDNANEDLDALAKKLGQDLHEQQEVHSLKSRLLTVLVHYGPELLEAALRVACELGGVPPPPPVPSGGAPS